MYEITLRTIEVRIRLESDSRKWMDIPIAAIHDIPDDAPWIADDFCKAIGLGCIVLHQPVIEIRWNWEGSQQGHYISTFTDLENHRGGGHRISESGRGYIHQEVKP